MGLWMGILLSLPIVAFALRGENVLLFLGQVPDATSLAQQYLFLLVWSVAPALCFEAILNFTSALNRPERALWIMVMSFPSTLCSLFADLWGVRPASARAVRSGFGDGDRELWDALGRLVVRHNVPPLP